MLNMYGTVLNQLFDYILYVPSQCWLGANIYICEHDDLESISVKQKKKKKEKKEKKQKQKNNHTSPDVVLKQEANLTRLESECVPTVVA